MSHPLQQMVRAVSRRSRRLLLLYGVSCFLTIFLLAACAAGLADYWGRFRDPGVRIILSASTLVLLVWSFVRFVAPAVQHRISNLQVARRIERRFPELQDRLSSSIEFLEQGESAVGSVDLRRNIVAEASTIARRLDLFDAIDPTTPHRTLAGFTAALLMLTGVCLFDQRSAWLAAERLVFPWAENAWPRRHALAFATLPPRVAAGQDFEIELIDRKGLLPSAVTAEYWFLGDDITEIVSRRMKPAGQRMVDHLANVTRSFRLRAVGGDDDTMPWHTVEVVEPPRVMEFEIHVQPPEYTGWPADSSGRHLRVVEGTQLWLSAKANKPLKSVNWRGTTRHQADQVVAQLHEDGLGFAWPRQPFVADESGTFWFELTDRDDVTNDLQLRCELQVVRDAPPTVSVESPGLDAVFTPQARVLLKATVKDDLEIDAVSLHFRDQQVRLESAQVASLRDQQPGSAHGDLRVVEYAWDLSQMPELGPGDSVEFHVTASDFKPQLGHSGTRRLNIVSSAEFERRSGQRQEAIRHQLQEALRVQRSAWHQVRVLQLQFEETATLGVAGVEPLRAAELQQRNVRSLLQSEPDGVLPLVESLLVDARSNRVRSGTLEPELVSLSRRAGQLIDEHLYGIEQELRDALVDADGRDRQFGTRLSRTSHSQQQVVARLERLLGEFEHRENYRQFARELGQIRDQQNTLTRATLDLDTVGMSRGDLAPEQAAALRRLAFSQRELARRFDRLQGDMQGVADSMADSDPSISATLGNALQRARSTAVGGLMREAAEGVEENQLGRAGQLQDRIQRGLDDVIDVLSNRGSLSENALTSADHLSALAARIFELASRQETVALGTEELSRVRGEQGGRLRGPQLTDLRQLAQNQRDLGRETVSLAVSETTLEVFAFGLRLASREMLRAAARLEQGLTDQTTTETQAAALRRLRGLHAALRNVKRSPGTEPTAPPAPPSQEPDAAGRQVSELRLLKEMQLEINRRTAEIDQLRDAAGVLPTDLQRELAELMTEQGSLSAIVMEIGQRGEER